MKIGNLALDSRLVAAPMAGVFDASMRILLREFGAALVFTEMISVEGIVRQERGSVSLVTCLPEETPLGVQLFGRNPDAFSRAAGWAEGRGAALIDINMGCPVRKVVKQGAGAALLREPELCARIVIEVKRSVALPVTAKIRAGWDASSVNCLDLACRLQDAGADAVILHPRTAVQFFSETADWSLVRDIAARLSIPVVGSGDIMSRQEAEERLRESRAAFVMIGRGAAGRPWVFSAGAAAPNPDELLDIIDRHRALIEELYPPKTATSALKRHCMYYLKALPRSASLRVAIMEKRGIAAIMDLVRDYLTDIIQDTHAANG